MRLIVNNSAAKCSISLKVCSLQFEHMTPDVLHTFKDKGPKVKVTASLNAGENLLITIIQRRIAQLR